VDRRIISLRRPAHRGKIILHVISTLSSRKGHMSGFDEIFDFVIVGSGGGSMCAGLLMRSAGKKV
jgi:hypothetical protein